MADALFRGDRRTRQRRRKVAAAKRPEWLELAEAGVLYFGVTLLPLLVVIVLYQWGVIG
jgi:hypothetical protein